MGRGGCISSWSRMTRSRDSRRRAPEADEHALWSRAMADVKPLRRVKPAKAVAEPAPPARRVAVDREPPLTAAPANIRPPRRPVAPASSPAGVLGIDKNTLTRLKRGDLSIDGRLDLHGMTQVHAHDVLDRCIAAGVSRGARLILVITGKGVGGDGVLRRMLPRWLRAGPQATRILRIEPAHAKHGGSGAWYVYLRRRRDGPA